jgi:hypothetical protein
MDMRPLCLIAFFLLFADPDCPAQVLGVIGSSTAAGGGATVFDSSWVGRTQLFFKNRGELTKYFDLAYSGSTTWNGMPSSFVFPHGVTITPADTPDRADNETMLLRLGSNVVVVAYANNDIVNGFTLTQCMSNLRVIYDSVLAAGKTCWVTTTQPRSDQPDSIRRILLQGRDSVLNEFPGRALNFWDPVVDPSTLGILPQYGAPDLIHLNDAGHAQLALVAENANIMDATPLALTLTAFNAKWTDQGVLLQWSSVNDDASDPIHFDVQRSTDATSFTSLYQTTASSAASASWTWTDTRSPAGTSFYRLSWVDGTKTNYSKIVSINRPGEILSIGNCYLSGSAQLVSEIELPSPGTASIAIFALSGRLILTKTYTGLAPSVTLTIPLPPLAEGEYVLKIVTPDGQQTAKPFVKF